MNAPQDNSDWLLGGIRPKPKTLAEIGQEKLAEARKSQRLRLGDAKQEVLRGLPPELHRLALSAVYVAQRERHGQRITPQSRADDQTRYVLGGEIDVIKRALLDPKQRAAVQQAVDMFRLDRVVVPEPKHSYQDAKRGADGQLGGAPGLAERGSAAQQSALRGTRLEPQVAPQYQTPQPSRPSVPSPVKTEEQIEAEIAATMSRNRLGGHGLDTRPGYVRVREAGQYLSGVLAPDIPEANVVQQVAGALAGWPFEFAANTMQAADPRGGGADARIDAAAYALLDMLPLPMVNKVMSWAGKVGRRDIKTVLQSSKSVGVSSLIKHGGMTKAEALKAWDAIQRAKGTGNVYEVLGRQVDREAFTALTRMRERPLDIGPGGIIIPEDEDAVTAFQRAIREQEDAPLEIGEGALKIGDNGQAVPYAETKPAKTGKGAKPQVSERGAAGSTGQVVPESGAAPEPSTTPVSPLPETQAAKGLADETRQAMLDAGRSAQEANAAAFIVYQAAKYAEQNGLPLEQVVAKAVGDIDPTGKLAQIALTDTEQALSITTLAPKTKEEVNRSFAERVQQRVHEVFGGKIDTKIPENREMLARVMAHDAHNEIATNPNNNALGWYERKVSEALRLATKQYPELASDEGARGAYTFALAVTSNGQKVAENFKWADQVYDHWKRTGQMPLFGKGAPGKQMKEAFRFWNENVPAGADPVQFLKFLNTDFTVAEARAMGINVSGEWADQVVSGAHAVGPKIGGGFLRNLSGYFDSLTSDRWFMRTWGRMTGNLVNESVKAEAELIAKFKAALSSVSDEELARYGFTREMLDDEDALIELAEGVHKQFAKKNAAGKTYTDKRPFTRAAKNLDDFSKNTNDAPTAEARAHQRMVVERTKELLKQEYGIDITTADLQALVWYPEQRAWGAGGNAVDYADAARSRYGNLKNPEIHTSLTDPSYKLGSLTPADRLGEQRSRVLGRLRRSLYGGLGKGSDAGRQALPSAYARRSNKSGSTLLADGSRAKITGTYSMSQTWKNAIETILRPNGARAIPTPTVYEVGAGDFHRLISNAVESLGDNGAPVHVYSPKEYAQMRVFIAEDGTAGFAIKPDGDIVSVFRHGDSPHQGVTPAMMQLAIDLGGKKLDAFDTATTRLPSLYGRSGFKEVARMKFDINEAPSWWNVETMGEPDVVFMVHDPSFPGGKPARAPYVDAYDEALRLQDQAIAAHPAPTLMQKGAEGVKGFYTAETRVIELVKGKADISTVIHETGHHIKEVLLQGEHADRIRRLYGGSDDVAGHERFARHLEHYFRTGNAPTPELADIFARIKEWMKTIYAKWSGDKPTDEVKSIFGDIFSDVDDVSRQWVDAGDGAKPGRTKGLVDETQPVQPGVPAQAADDATPTPEPTPTPEAPIKGAEVPSGGVKEPVTVVRTRDVMHESLPPHARPDTPEAKAEWLREHGAIASDTGKRLRYAFELSDGRVVSMEGVIRNTNPELWARIQGNIKEYRSAEGRERLFSLLPKDAQQQLIDIIPVSDIARMAHEPRFAGQGKWAALDTWLKDNAHPLAGSSGKYLRDVRQKIFDAENLQKLLGSDTPFRQSVIAKLEAGEDVGDFVFENLPPDLAAKYGKAADDLPPTPEPTLTPEAPKRPVPPSAEPHRLETLSPEPNPEGVTMGRRIIWNGKGREFLNRDFEEAYDLIDSGLNDVRRLEREAAQAADAETKRTLLSEATALRKGAIEAKTELFEYMDSLTGRVDPDLDAEFAMRVAGEDMTERTARVASKAKQMGGTRLPVGDLRELFSDLRHLAGAALQAGQKYGAWVSGLVKQAGKQIIPYAKRAWERASNAIRNANATRPKGMTQAGGFGRAKAPKVDLPEHLRTAEEPKGVMRSPWRWLKATLGAETEAADLATKDLGKRLGKDLTNTDLDIRSAINTQTRLHPKVDDAVMKGIRGPDGERITMGLPDFIDGLRRDGIDPDLWQGYRRALREMDLADRGGIPDDRMAANTAVVDDFLGTHGDAVARWDAEWQKIADAQLDLYEQYGLKPPGWAAKIREENPFYYPLVRAGTDVERTMGALNPQPGLASPMGKVIRAIGGNQYQDGFASMAAQTERLITEGEKNLALLPFMDEMSKQADQTWVREITDLADGEDLGDMPDLFGQPKKLKEGDDPILTLYENGKPRRFEVDPYIWKAIQGLNPQEFNAVQTVLRAAAQPARFFTTGKGNPLFGIVFNPMIDISSGVLLHGLNPLRAAQGFWHALLAKFGKETNLWKDVIESNVLFGQGNTKDFVEARRYFDPSNRKALDKEMQSLGVRALHKVDEIYSAMRDAIEEGTRVGMFAQQKAARIRKGLDPKAASKQASQIAADLFNFGEPSTLGRTLSGLGVPYANIVSQAAMSAARGFKRSPSKFMARMGLLMTAPALWEYQTYKDDPEWKALPDYVKMGGMTFRTGTFTGNPQEGSWVSVRVPAELGVIFRGLPMRALEAMESGEYGQAVKDQLYSMSDQWTPSFMPTLIAAAGQASFYAGSGATPDLRFFSFRSYPVDEDASDTAKAKAAYKQIRQQADTLLGSMGRMAAQGVAHAIDPEIEPKAPSLLQRYRPQPGQYLQDNNDGPGRSPAQSIGQSAAKPAARQP